MFEKVAEIASFESLSMKQRKKMAAKFARARSSRNQAYSNLVKRFFLNYVRLSIHAQVPSDPTESHLILTW